MADICGRERKVAFETAKESVTRLEVCEARVTRILIAVDFSEASRRALEYAAALARKLGTEIILLHVFEGVLGELRILEASFVETSFREEARETLAEWERGLVAMGLPVKTVFREGRAIGQEILDVAKECGADLLVVGKHGSESFFLKNTVKKVLGQAPCPVLVGT